MVKFVEFNAMGQFDAWLIVEDIAQGYPRVGNRKSDGVPQPNKQQTVKYTDAITGDSVKVLAIMDDDVITPHGAVEIPEGDPRLDQYLEKLDGVP